MWRKAAIVVGTMGLRFLRQHHCVFFSSPASIQALSTPTPPKPTNSFTLTPQDLARINLLIPRLCASNHHSTAVDLAASSLLLGNPPPPSLIHSLAAQPNIAHPMSLLTRLKYSPAAHPFLRPIAAALVSSYLRRRNPRHALEVYTWMAKPASPCPPDADLCRVLVHGLCRSGMILEGLGVFRAMVAAEFEIGIDLRKRVCNGLLREAMVGEAQGLDEAFAGVADGDGGDGFEKVLELLDHVIANWVQ